MGFSGLALDAGPLGPLVEARGLMPFQTKGPAPAAPGDAGALFSFNPIFPSKVDDLILPEGFDYHVVAAWGDRLPGTNGRFGYNADYTAFLPTASDPAGEGVLFVNHEYVSLADEGNSGV